MDPILPSEVRDALWDVDPDSAWRDYPDFVVERVLARGTWDAIQWVRGQIGDARIRDILISSRCRLLSAPQARFWELIVGLPADEVSRWLSAPGRHLLDERAP